MSSITLQSSEILKKALFSLPKGMPISSKHLKEFGISRQLVHHYVQNGWFKQLGSGYYLQAEDELTEIGAISSLQTNGVKVHIGGKSALTLKGFTHYLNMGENRLTLYGHKTRKLPNWILQKFQISLTNSTLFNEPEELKLKHSISRLNHEPNNPLVSEPERAILELLDLIPNKQTIEETKQIMEGLQSLRSKKMQILLECCKKIKVKRLFWQIANKLDLPVLKKMDPLKIDFGSKSAYILRGDNNLILRNPNE